MKPMAWLPIFVFVSVGVSLSADKPFEYPLIPKIIR